MANIKFSYLYRDGGNYKNYKEIIFTNPGNVNIMELEALIRSKLYDGMFFYADQWLLPDMHFDTWDNDLDHTWHEFEGVAYIEESANFPIPLHDWIENITLIKPTF